MLKRPKSSLIKNNKGMAVLELMPTLFIYMLLINFSLGFFGVIHAGILHSIAARNYTFETMFHRSNLNYHTRVTQGDIQSGSNFAARGQRTSGIVAENYGGMDWVATQRPIAFASSFGGTNRDGDDLSDRRGIASDANVHNRDIKAMNEGVRNENIGVKTVWIQTVYGMCLDAKCGDEN